jgi:hypothetical protein
VKPLCEMAAKRGWKVYILASAPEIAPIAAEKNDARVSRLAGRLSARTFLSIRKRQGGN